VLLLTNTDKKLIRYRMEGEFTMENIGLFLQAYYERGIKPYVKSQPLPGNSNATIIKEVSKNYE